MGIYDRIEGATLRPVWVTLVERELALARARVAPRGSLYGIPFAVKDNIDVAGLPTTAGCPAFAYQPQHTAFVVQRLLDAGAILIGKTNMDQFATGLVGTRSPYGACSCAYQSHYISGGSSSGSAIAVAGGLASFALGTDTAGSGRVPAAFNNIVGLKPSRGLLSTSGVVPACRSLDCVSVFALNCADAASVLNVAKVFDPADPYSRPWPVQTPPFPLRVRCGVPSPSQLEFFGDEEYARLYRQTVASLNADLIEIDFVPFRKAAELLYSGPYVAERFAAVGKFIESHPDQVDATVASIILTARRYDAASVFAAQYRLAELVRETQPSWDKMDFLVLPTAPTIYTLEQVRREPLQLNANLGYYTNFVNLLGLSAVAVPAGFTSEGLPAGVTVVGPACSDYNLLQFASQIHFSGPTYRAPDGAAGWVKISVVGAHLSGQPLNRQLTERGARLIETTRTALDYKMFALTSTVPPKPGLLRIPGLAGPGIETEVWEMSPASFGSFVAGVPPPLSIGTCELISGEQVKGFLCEPYAVAGMSDITHHGAWRSYLRSG